MRFEKGKSGNPAGRPKGIRDRKVKFRDMVEPYSDKLISKAIFLALNDNNESMLKFLLSRILPAAPKDDVTSASLVGNNNEERALSILKDLKDQEITPIEAFNLMSLLGVHSRIIDIEVLKKFAEEIKEKNG